MKLTKFIVITTVLLLAWASSFAQTPKKLCADAGSESRSDRTVAETHADGSSASYAFVRLDWRRLYARPASN